MKIRFLFAILLCQLIPPSASSAVFTFTSPDLPASIQGEASVSDSIMYQSALNNREEHADSHKGIDHEDLS